MSAVRTILESARGTLVFGHAPFLLHALSFSAPALSFGEGDVMVGARTAEIVGYILPEGEDACARASEMEAARRLVGRIAGCKDGFTLTHGARSIRLWCRQGPEFCTEAPLNGSDAARFTLRCESAEEDGTFRGAQTTATGRGLGGALIFPLAVTEKTAFGSVAGNGTLTVENPGDLAAGFILTVTAAGDSIEEFSVSFGEDEIRVTHTLEAGEALLIDTRPGCRDVRADGASILDETDWRSEFFTLPPGESTLCWSCEGGGQANLSLSFAPRYL